MTSARSWLFRAIALVGSLALVLLVGEVIARIATPARLPRKAMPPLSEGAPVLRSIRELGAPHVEGIHKRVPYRTNSLGMRGPEWTSQAASGVFRVLVSGDSVTVGSGVREEDRYSQQLESTLEPEDPDVTGYEFINSALGGVNAKYAINRLVRGIEAYSPHLLVYGFTVNDIEGPDYISHEVSPGARRKTWIRSARYRDSFSYLLRALWPRWVMLEAELFGDEGPNKAKELLENYFENPAAWAAIEASLTRLADLAAEHGVCAHVFVHTSLGNLDASHSFLPVYERVATTARRLGMTANTSFETFEGEDVPSLMVAVVDSHPNARGHALLARSLREGLLELPARCWELPGGLSAQPTGAQRKR